MAGRTPRLTASQVTTVLQRHHFIFISQRGSHQKWRNPDSAKQVIVPMHKGKPLPLGTLKSIVEGSGIPEEDFRP
jgi:predicted RNA binding protein YcfA (HicA-like mRNA interferase family)